MAALAACGSGGEGPLSNLGADPIGFSIPLDVGESGSISGPFVVKNTGGRPIQLDGVELVGLRKGLTFRGAYVVPYPQHPSRRRPRSATIGIDSGYHRSRKDRALDGATVAPHNRARSGSRESWPLRLDGCRCDLPRGGTHVHAALASGGEDLRSQGTVCRGERARLPASESLGPLGITVGRKRGTLGWASVPE
jgi:hypothetical protein